MVDIAKNKLLEFIQETRQKN